MISIYRKFNEYFTLFATRTYDVLDPDNNDFHVDCKNFKEQIDCLDRQLASVLCEAFDECHNLQLIFKVSMNNECAVLY